MQQAKTLDTSESKLSFTPNISASQKTVPNKGKASGGGSRYDQLFY